VTRFVSNNERLIIAVDSKGGRIVIKGWREATDLSAEETLQLLEPYCAGFLCTYVDKGFSGNLSGKRQHNQYICLLFIRFKILG
jgi:phosphoribosylformimino-5-aminoimidazole carboxamide ribonucleotide (ProFAR) isomerase